MKRMQPVILLLAAMTLFYFTNISFGKTAHRELPVPRLHACWPGPSAT